MFKTVRRAILPNPFKQILKKARKANKKHFLLAWNRGLGDIALGLYPIVYQIKRLIPDAKLTFLIRKNLEEGFQLFQGVDYIVAPNWVRGKEYDIYQTLEILSINPNQFDVIIEKPDPTYWVKHLRGVVTPKLLWNKKWDSLSEGFSLDSNKRYIGVQVSAETNYGHWRNWPIASWEKLFKQTEREKHFILFGYGDTPKFHSKNILDLRGKTNLFELLSIVINHCHTLILPDSGILSMVYYLDKSFPIRVISLWGDPRHGILKQNVSSPNPLLIHNPLIGEHKNLGSVTVEHMIRAIQEKEE